MFCTVYSRHVGDTRTCGCSTGLAGRRHVYDVGLVFAWVRPLVSFWVACLVGECGVMYRGVLMCWCQLVSRVGNIAESGHQCLRGHVHVIKLHGRVTGRLRRLEAAVQCERDVVLAEDT